MMILALACLCSALIFTGAAEDPLLISAFNVQVFGLSKMSKPDVVATLVDIVQRYDLIVIQEIRDSSGDAFVDLVNRVNAASDGQYTYIISPRSGRTSSKEQYGYIYKPSRLQVVDALAYPDNTDIFEREPYVVTFRNLVSGAFQQVFNTIVLHAKPDDAVSEVSALAGVYYDVKAYDSISDAVIMGDLNADCNYITASEWSEVQLCTDPSFNWKIPNTADTTVSSTDCAYDRVVTAGSMTANVVQAGVFDFETYYGLTYEQAKDVSDHYPVEFYVY